MGGDSESEDTSATDLRGDVIYVIYVIYAANQQDAGRADNYSA